MNNPSVTNKRNWLLSDDEIIRLIKKVNKSARARRSEIALERNKDPLKGPVIREHWQVVLMREEGTSEIAPDPSIYVQKKHIRLDYAKEIIVSAVEALSAIRRDNDKIERASQQVDKERVDSGLTPLRAFEGHLLPIAFYDQQVVTELAAAYTAITGEPPTMGGYKQTVAKSESGNRLVSFAGDDRELASDRRSPYATFLIELLKLCQLKRLNGEDYSYSVLRAAMKNHWQGDQSTDEEINKQDEKGTEDRSVKKKPGRPPKGSEPSRLQAKLRGTHPETEDLTLEDCTDRDVMAIIALDRRRKRRNK